MIKFLDNTGLTYLWGKIKALVPGLSKKTQSIPFGQVDSTSTATVFKATIDGIDELRDGVCCYLMNGVVTSASGYTLNINNLGAKPVYQTLAEATRSSTVFNKNYTMLFVYNSSRVSGGCWDIFYGYNSNTTYDLNNNYVSIGNAVTANYPLAQYSLCAFDVEGHLSAFTTTATTSTGKSLVPTAFPIGAKIYAVSSSLTKNTAYEFSSGLRTTCTEFDIRYSSVYHNLAIFPNSSFNRIYMVVNIDSSNNTFTLTTQNTSGYTNNFTNQRSLIAGNFYIEIGFNSANDTSYYYCLVQDNPLYYYDGTNLVPYAVYRSGGTDDYDDLTDKPQINSVTLSGNKSAGDLGLATSSQGALADSAYQLPSGGIPDTDLSSAVQTSLGLADTALQSYTETDPVFTSSVAYGISSSDISNWNSKGTYSKPSGGIPASDIASGVIPTVPTNVSDFTNDAGYTTNTGTITSVKMNGTTVSSSGEADLGTVITSHQDISGKADRSIFVDATTAPASLDPNKVYQFGTLSGDTTFPAFSSIEVGDTEVKIWCWTFTTPSTAPTITWPAGITNWVGGTTPTINASKTYEITVMSGLATIIES